MAFLNPLVLAAVWVCLPTSDCPELEETSVSIHQAKQHQQQGQYAVAETLLRQVLKTSAEESRDMIEALNQLAGVLFLKADYTEAEVIVRRALELNSRQAQPDDLKQAENLNTLAEILRARDRIVEADDAQRQSLGIFETRLGKDNPSTLIVQENRASLLAQQGRVRQAATLSRRVLASREAQHQPNNPSLAITLSNLAGYESAAGNVVNSPCSGHSGTSRWTQSPSRRGAPQQSGRAPPT
jgi:tetratricopeptide (TPR) repeat protein